MASIKDIKDALERRPYPELWSIAQGLMEEHPRKLSGAFNAVLSAPESQQKQAAIRVMIGWASHSDVKDALSIMLNLAPDVDVQTAIADEAKQAAVASARWAKRSVIIAVLALVVSAIALVVNWLGL
ncbi:MAG: hypothetical protein WBE26_09775 [Phycisphaerae bacterium]